MQLYTLLDSMLFLVLGALFLGLWQFASMSALYREMLADLLRMTVPVGVVLLLVFWAAMHFGPADP